MHIFIFFAGIFAFVILNAQAHDADVDAVRSIDNLYFHRDVLGNLDQSLVEINSNLERVEKSDGRQGLVPEFLWMRCRSLVRRGEKREKNSDKLADYDLARQDCEKSVSLSSGSVDARFWNGISMGRWGEAKGVLKALFLIKPIRREMAATLALDPNHGGAHRVLGEMLWQIPGLAGGDKKQALVEYETAVRLSPNHSSNYQTLAEAYLYYGRKDDAIRTLNAVSAIASPEDPAEYPDDLSDAKKLLAKLTAK